MSRAAPLLHADDKLHVTVWALAYDTANAGTNVELFRSVDDALNRWLDELGVEKASVRRRFKKSWKNSGDDAYQEIFDEYVRDPCDTYQLDSQIFTIVTPRSWAGRTKYFTPRGKRPNPAGARGSRVRRVADGVLPAAGEARGSSAKKADNQEPGPERTVPMRKRKEGQEVLR